MVISIITLILSASFSYIGSARAKSRDSVRLSDMKQINTATNLFYEDRGILPTSIGGGESTSLVSSGYLPTEPKDPKTGESYKFYTSSGDNNKTFVAYTSYETQFLEASTTPQQVGVMVGNVSNMSALCEIATFLNKPYPYCVGSEPHDHIFGVTSGHRSSGGSSGAGGSGLVTCTSFTYSGWSGCVDGIQSRTYTGIPTGCTGGSPDYSHPCVEGFLQWSGDLNVNMDWYSAKAFCENTQNDYSRLPTLEELNTALSNQFISGGSNPGGFSNQFYWSDTYNTDEAFFAVYDTIIRNSSAGKFITSFLKFRCVR